MIATFRELGSDPGSISEIGNLMEGMRQDCVTI